MGIEPTTSGLDLPLLCRLSYEVGQRKSGTISYFYGLFMGSNGTLIYTSELILCFTICVLSATRHNIHMYPYFLFAAIYGLFMGSNGTLIYTSELILCFTICVLSATRHNIHMYPYFLFAAIHLLIVPDFLCPTS